VRQGKPRRLADEAAHGRIHAAGIALVLAIAALVYIAGLHPLAVARMEAARLEAALASQRQTLRDAEDLLSRGREQLDRFERQLAQAPLKLEDVTQLNQRLADLTALARDGALLIHQMQPGEAMAGDDYAMVAVRLTGEATYQTFTRFIDQLHQRMPDIEVRSLDIRDSPASGSGASTAAFRLECVWYARLASDAARDGLAARH
jgi:Tfp pilus assembly protein PilO